MAMKTSLVTLFLVAAGPASAECVYKNVYDHLANEYVTVPFSCPPSQARQSPKYRNWHECPVRQERNAATGHIYQARSCA